LRDFCNARVPASVADKLRLDVVVRGTRVTVVEERLPWREDLSREWTRSPIAEFRFDLTSQRWSLYWRDSRSRWRLFEDAAPTPDIETLVGALDEDALAVFWG
jgi:hypothetical protein